MRATVGRPPSKPARPRCPEPSFSSPDSWLPGASPSQNHVAYGAMSWCFVLPSPPPVRVISHVPHVALLPLMAVSLLFFLLQYNRPHSFSKSGVLIWSLCSDILTTSLLPVEAKLYTVWPDTEGAPSGFTVALLPFPLHKRAPKQMLPEPHGDPLVLVLSHTLD